MAHPDPSSPSATFDAADHPSRLNLGCGFDKRAGWLNVDLQDFHDPDLVADVRHLSMLPAGRYDEILAQDVLEHLPRSDTDTCLADWHRLLRDAGRLTLQLPDLVACGRRLAEHDTVAHHRQWIHQLWGTQAYTGDFHLAGFTDLTVIDALARAGFHRIELDTVDRWMLEVTAEKAPDSEARHPLAVGFVAGFHAPEGEAGAPWRWSEADATLLVHNITQEPAVVDLSARLSAPGPRQAWLAVTAGGHHEDVRLSREPTEWRRRFRVHPGPTRVRFHTDAPPLAAPGDDRSLVLRFAQPTVTLN